MLSSEQLAAAEGLLSARCGLDALWVFGSVAAGRDRPESDVDLAVLVRRLPASLERVALREELAEALGRAVDLVFLEDASPILTMQVLAKGRLILSRAPRRVAELVVRTITAYADLKRSRAPVERALEQRMTR